MNTAKFYVENDDKLIYEASFDGSDLQADEDTASRSFLRIHLNLYCGYDYVNPDGNDEQGWVTADNFIDDVQYDVVICYLFKESIEEALDANDYKIVDKVPFVHGKDDRG